MVACGRRSIWIGVLLVMVALLAVGGGRAVADDAVSASTGPSVPKGDREASWPQYRGPTRDGIAPPGPKLRDSWAKEGPKLLWKAAALWPDKAGKAGCASISIGGGRAFTFAYIRRKIGKVVFTAQDLVALGWMEGVPADLAAKVEDARINPASPGWKKQGAEQAAYIKEFIAALDAEQGRQFGSWIERRLTWTGHPVNNGTIAWATLTKLAAIQDKEFATLEELDHGMGGGLFGWSNPIRSYITDKVFGIFDTVICLDASTGAELWRKEFPGAPVHQVLDIGPSSTPTISDGNCYVAGSAGMYCLSVKDGTVIWQAKTKYSSSSPLVMDGAVYVLSPEATAYDAKTGQVLWTQPGLKHSDSSFTSWASGGKNYLLVAFEGSVYDHPPGCLFCLDPADGKPVWSTYCPTCSIPVLAGPETLVVAGSYEFASAFKITPAKAQELWKTKRTGSPRGASPVVFGDHVYLAGACHSDKPLRCLDLKTGELKWEQTKTASAEASSPILVDGKIIALLEESEQSLFVLMYRATPEKYEELGRFNPGAGPGASPSIVNGKLYLRLQDGVACYDLTAEGNDAGK
jgi:outer membrane protein assembly factor BamB